MRHQGRGFPYLTSLNINHTLNPWATRDYIWIKFGFMLIFVIIIQGEKTIKSTLHIRRTYRNFPLKDASAFFCCCCCWVFVFLHSFTWFWSEDWRDPAIIMICRNSHGPCHSCCTEHSTLPPSHRSAVRAGHFITLLSLCSSLSPSEYRDLARVITSGDAFNYCHSTRGGFRKAVIMPHWEWNEATLLMLV